MKFGRPIYRTGAETFTKRLQGFRDLPYTKRLRLLNLQLLEVRRLHFDLILCNKIVFGLISINVADFF